MRKVFSLLVLAMAASPFAPAADIQGVLADWNCTEKMTRDGREKTIRQDKSCSLVPNSNRAAYGLITDDKKFYRLDAAGNHRAKELLNNSHDKDNLRVIATGELDGNMVKVQSMSIL